ncbi:MAG: hypothetical protein NT166_06425 [Candidatus Aminicenantes bacterium]|nr:hypothetical protein [Candidatus Aminicenantes bacterium]
MKKIKTQVYLKWVIALIFLVVNFNLYSYICLNGGGRGYVDGGDSIANNTIEAYIIDGAGFYLAAKADIETLLNLIELKDSQGLGYKGLNVVEDNAVAKLKNAIAMYEKLIKEAESTPYNEDVQAKLKAIDYEIFMLSNGLNKVVFDAVSGFLKDGDITGCFKKIQADMKNILGMLQTINGETTLNRLPDLSIIWRLNETCCETSLFGSYVARVFNALPTNR